MKKKLLLSILIPALALGLIGGGVGLAIGLSKKKAEEVDFDFSISLQSGKTILEIDQTDKVQINANKQDGERSYTYTTTNAKRLSVDDSGNVAALGVGSVKIKVTEAKSEITRSLDLNVIRGGDLASGGYNFTQGAKTMEERTEILGKLEKYAIDSHLTGITLFENGGYVKYRDRLQIPASEYITGYGFGILTEGDITAPLAAETVEAYKYYYHSAQTSDPNKINAWNATGSQVSDLNGYITSSFWGNKMKATKDGYEWYPVLAKEVDGRPDNKSRPTPIYNGASEPGEGTANPLNLYKTWRIYVKTGADGLKYRYNGSYTYEDANHVVQSFDGRPVALEDYAFVFKLLLTGANKQSRGAEMAADKTYGIKGAQLYYNRTKDITDESTINNIWDEMTSGEKFTDQQLGIKVGTDSKGSYIQLEILNEIDAFTAMYTFSSNLYSPVPEDFIKACSSEGTVMKGILNYGQFSTSNSIVDNTISLGAYYLETWNNSYITFKQDEQWIERTTYPDRHKIKGIKITTYPNATQESLYEYYGDGLLDSCGIPVSYIDVEADQPDVRKTKGDSTFKLNVNSCTQERWDELNQKLWKNTGTDIWDVKPWMSNDNFLNGLYWSIDRNTFATSKGQQPSIDYFSNAYLTDPENGVSYNDSDAHKAAVRNWHTVTDGVDDYGYSKTKAVKFFKDAVNQLVASNDITLGTPSNPYVINIHIRWMYQTDIEDYGNEIGNYFESAFNDPQVCGGAVKLEVIQEAVTNWEDVYNVWMMKGRFDLAFGAISGNTYNPLNFLEVLKSDNSSGFTLNWGADTGKVDDKNPLIYDEDGDGPKPAKKWSFDALWEVSNSGGVVEKGVSVKTVKNYYFDGLAKKIDGGAETSDYSTGVSQEIKLEFVNVEGVEINISKVQVYAVGGTNTDVAYVWDNEHDKLTINIDATKGGALKAEMVELNNKGKSPGDEGYVTDPFVRGKYGVYWTFEVYYTISISGGTPAQSYVTLVVNQADQATA